MSSNNSTVAVKICGISKPEHALVALDAGANMIGLVFAKSPRRITVEEAQIVVAAVRMADPHKKLKIVGLFVNETADVINQVADEVGLDRIQLSGDEPPHILNKLRMPAIGSIRAETGNWQAAQARLRDWVFTSPWAIHMDSHVPGIYGGTGEVGDWDIAAQFADRYRLILAGGLTPDNVSDAIRRVKPYAVDVSTGVETDGVKDADKIRSFIARAKSVRRDEPAPASQGMMGQQR